MLTQAAQVAYHLRQKHRAFDTACQFELLASELMKRKTCIKSSYDLSKRPIDEVDPQIFNFKNKAEMVQLLLALSKEPNASPPPSEFASRFLRVKMRENNDSEMFVKPNAIDYIQSDCQRIDRDKLLVNRGYVPYSANSFENLEFKSMLAKNKQDTQGMPYDIDFESSKQINRFNVDLLEAT